MVFNRLEMDSTSLDSSLRIVKVDAFRSDTFCVQQIHIFCFDQQNKPVEDALNSVLKDVVEGKDALGNHQTYRVVQPQPGTISLLVEIIL